MLKKILDLRISVGQMLGAFLMVIPGVFCVYVVLLFFHDWDLKMGSTGHFDAPYRKIIPVECRADALAFGYTAVDMSTEDNLLMRPATVLISLPKSEEKLGFGMKGIPCMGYNFLMVLHATNFKKVEKYLDKDGNVVGTITYEVMRPYRSALSRAEMEKQTSWKELDGPSEKDAGLVGYKKGK